MLDCVLTDTQQARALLHDNQWHPHLPGSLMLHIKGVQAALASCIEHQRSQTMLLSASSLEALLGQQIVCEWHDTLHCRHHCSSMPLHAL
jgi:hypothetical protein